MIKVVFTITLFFLSCNTHNSSKVVSSTKKSDRSIALTDAYKIVTENVKLDIYRQNREGCLSGYISINDEIVGYTVERPEIDNINDISAIPAGSYTAHIRTDGKLKWRIELENVPERKNVQIHVGNYINIVDPNTGLERCSIKGCIIIGETLGDDFCSVFDSKKALNKLKEKIELIIIPIDKQINVRIH